MTAKKQALLCVDVDGTLINAEEKIHPLDIALLKDFPEDVQFILTTGRSLHGAKSVLRQNGLFEGRPLPFPGVFMNGGAAYFPQEVICTVHFFSGQTLKALVGLAANYPKSAFTFFSLEKVYLVNPNPFARHISQLHYLDAIEINRGEVPKEVIKMMILDHGANALKEIQKQTGGIDAESAFSLPYAFEINPPGITKANTLQSLLKDMDLSDLPVFTVGDGENDLSMFAHSKRCFAPTSAHPAVLEQADRIINREKDGLLLPILDEILS
jgi:hypothetical protein